MGERTVLGMLVRAQTFLTFFIRVRGQHEDGREEAHTIWNSLGKDW